MGGRSRSSSSNTTINETDNSNLQQNDNQVAFSLEDVGDNNTLNVTDGGAVAQAFTFGGDALDFGTTSLRQAHDFGRDILNEATEISREAIDVAGNAQTNAFRKIKDIADAFSSRNPTTSLLLSVGGALALFGLFWLFQRGR